MRTLRRADHTAMATTTPRPGRVCLSAMALALVGAVAACTPSGPGSGVRTWTIPAGAHDANGATVATTSTDRLHFRVRFDESAQYATTDPANQADINKLRGFSDCSSHHQTDSARFGWRWTSDRVEILAYTYVGGARQSALLGSVQPGEWHEYELRATPSGYVFRLDGVDTAMPRGCSAEGLLKYQLWPYFGGDEVAPHTITLQMEELVS